MSAEGPRTAPGGVIVEEVTAVTPEVLEALRALLPELSSSAPPLTEAALEEIAQSPATILLVARRRGGRHHPGVAHAGGVQRPDGPEGVDRGRGRAQPRHGGAGWERRSCSRPTGAPLRPGRAPSTSRRAPREAANRLYVRLGFVRRETNVYRKTLD